MSEELLYRYSSKQFSCSTEEILFTEENIYFIPEVNLYTQTHIFSLLVHTRGSQLVVPGTPVLHGPIAELKNIYLLNITLNEGIMLHLQNLRKTFWKYLNNFLFLEKLGGELGVKFSTTKK